MNLIAATQLTRWSIFCLFIFAIWTLPLSLSSQTHPLICKDGGLIPTMELQSHKSLLDFSTSGFTDNYDAIYHRLEWAVDPAVRYIEGKVTSYFVPTVDTFRQICFDLSKLLSVAEVKYRGQSLPFSQTDTDLLKIEFAEILPIGQLDSISISYEGVPPVSDFGSFSQAMHQDAPIIWTLSEPYGAKDWWPCKQDLNDKVDSIDVIVHTPIQYRVASNGVLVNEAVHRDQKTHHWRHRYPIAAYLIAIGVTNYSVFSDFVPLDNGDSIEILNYVYPEQEAQIRTMVGNSVELMLLYNELFGLYPFADEKYGHAQFGFFGGMEHQTMSFMGFWPFTLQAHELAHQWFGDKVTCRSWQDIWLNEGFATYLEGLALENGLGNIQNFGWKDWLRGTALFVTSQPDGSVWVPDTTNVERIFSGRLSYAKGAMLLHMLRWKLGDDPFFQAIRNYLNDPTLAYGYARTADLQAHLEAQSGQDLNDFFVNWFYGEGFPSYQVYWMENQIQILQQTSHPSVDFFAMPVPILFKGEGQEQLLVFDHQYSGQIFAVDLPFRPEAVIFDPDLWILSRDNKVEFQPVATQELRRLKERLQLYPVPARDQLMLSFEAWPEIPGRITLYDMRGKWIQDFKASTIKISIPTAALSAGEYVLRIHTTHGPLSQTFVKN